MSIRVLTKEDYEYFLQREEDHFFDRKGIGLKPAKLEKYAVSFANSEGGEVIIGIKDAKEEPDWSKRWNGNPSVEDFNSYLQCLVNLSPSLPFRYEFFSYPGASGIALCVTLDKSRFVHATSDKTVYLREGAQSLPIKDPLKIQELAFAKGAASFEDSVIFDLPVDDIADSPVLKDFLSKQHPRMDGIDFLVNQNLVDLKTWDPKVCGVLLFGENPSSVMPAQCAVRIARYKTREDDPERDHLDFSESIEGHLYFQIHHASERIKEIMSSISVWTVDGLKTMDYPPEAIWEILVNAIIHRDYSISDNILISIYDDRIEIKSPGKFPGHVTSQNILDARYSRNKNLVRTLNRYPDPPNHDMGEGLNTTFQKMKEWRLKAPEIFEDGNYVIAILPHIPLASPEEAVLEFLSRGNKQITNKQAREITGIRSENEMKRVFLRLRDAGKIERVPGMEGPKAAWQLRGA
jgi:ATP-dependent DNA helicase RecG